MGRGQVQVGVADTAPGQAAPHLQAPSAGVVAARQPGLRVSWGRRRSLAGTGVSGKSSAWSPPPPWALRGASRSGPSAPNSGSANRWAGTEGRRPAGSPPRTELTGATQPLPAQAVASRPSRSQRHPSGHRALPPWGTKESGQFTSFSPRKQPGSKRPDSLSQTRDAAETETHYPTLTCVRTHNSHSQNGTDAADSQGPTRPGLLSPHLRVLHTWSCW